MKNPPLFDDLSLPRRQLLAAAAAVGAGVGLLALAPGAHSQVIKTAQTAPQAPLQRPEKPRLTLAVGGRNLLYYLPLTIAETLGYFKAEGLEVTIADFAGGSRALQALIGGSADVVSGAFEHTINMQLKGQRLRAFVL